MRAFGTLVIAAGSNCCTLRMREELHGSSGRDGEIPLDGKRGGVMGCSGAKSHRIDVDGVLMSSRLFEAWEAEVGEVMHRRRSQNCCYPS